MQDVDDFVGSTHENKGEFTVCFAYASYCGLDMARNGEIWHQIWLELWVQLAWGLGLERVIVEMDSTEAVEVIQANENEQLFSTVGCAIKDFLKCSWMVCVRHVFSEGNNVVDGCCG
ncbi:hypothetical protein J1N35_037405 [Gossypium stocksii]|uniref:RNase H type-1 domain-containing protein n=1 Tax=Gossypium stocksii TaxID=47602 RepID=A0A9D3ZKV6_9ROSI|nr:hypothetical protein J1N35_037405 [Gossypium stocksii]